MKAQALAGVFSRRGKGTPRERMLVGIVRIAGVDGHGDRGEVVWKDIQRVLQIFSIIEMDPERGLPCEQSSPVSGREQLSCS